ncbi:3-dehydroquinate synthase [Candidatus Nardonella dryophthoridicola]|uniref:3-dehydroquinate synthase n=1 Tax=Candidatus Nardonella dryophthoridicola TaxID=1971485 RepID=UPI001AD8897F|nr:3-dehydroquinate synthase [Candidatus Nardonella dryophthoridicola]QTJ62898.1 3-dehydroquinate synthase [Candidatus Nardonella dryophthoridicola]
MYELNISLQNSNYHIKIGFNILESIISKLYNYFDIKNKFIIITNNVLYKLYFRNIEKIFKKYHLLIDYIVIEDGEKNKSLFTSNNIFTYLLHKNYNRNIILVSLGGGVIGDITGFVSSIYQRGVKYIHIPTTLLSQVDSSIGGKTGVNHPLGKNMIGSFYQPSLVIIDTLFLKTLPNREYISGFSEIIKYGIIKDNSFFCWLENNYKKLLNLDLDIISECIYKSCLIKSNIISLDEKETKNLRSLLNLGHTYGHAIESFLGYGNLLHGEAISIGIIMASNLSFITKNISYEVLERIINIMKMFNINTERPSNMEYQDYIFYMKKDKKNSNSGINIVVPTNIGESKILFNVSESLIKNSIYYNK